MSMKRCARGALNIKNYHPKRSIAIHRLRDFRIYTGKLSGIYAGCGGAEIDFGGVGGVFVGVGHVWAESVVGEPAEEDE